MWRVDSLRGREIYLDSNVIIYAFENADPAASHNLGVIFGDIEKGIISARTSLIARAEVLVQPLRQKQDELVEVYRALLSGTQHVAVHPVDGGIADRAAELRARHGGLRLPDALHLATAILCGCDAFLTSDKRLPNIGLEMEILPLHEMGNL